MQNKCPLVFANNNKKTNKNSDRRCQSLKAKNSLENEDVFSPHANNFIPTFVLLYELYAETNQ